MDSGEISSLVALIGMLLTAFGAGDIVPTIGPAVQGILAIITFGASVWSFISHRNKTVAMTAAGIMK
jgi:hypothetical protein